jgi:hypothetical protein
MGATQFRATWTSVAAPDGRPSRCIAPVRTRTEATPPTRRRGRRLPVLNSDGPDHEHECYHTLGAKQVDVSEHAGPDQFVTNEIEVHAGIDRWPSHRDDDQYKRDDRPPTVRGQVVRRRSRRTTAPRWCRS